MNDIYQFSVPVFVKGLNGLKGCLEKTSAFAKEKGIDDATVLAEQLAPDMFPLVRQVQIACDNAKAAAARLSGVEVPKHEDAEKTIAELQARIDKVLTFVQSVSEDSFAGAADVKVVLPYFPDKFMTGFDYAREYAIPNFFFHTAIAYGLMRKMGVPLGKADFMFTLPLQDL